MGGSAIIRRCFVYAVGSVDVCGYEILLAKRAGRGCCEVKDGSAPAKYGILCGF